MEETKEHNSHFTEITADYIKYLGDNATSDEPALSFVEFAKEWRIKKNRFYYLQQLDDNI